MDRLPTPVFLGLPGGSDGKESTCNVGDLGLIPGMGRSPEGGQGNPLLYSCLENPKDRGAWRATVHGDTTSATERSTDPMTGIHPYKKRKQRCRCRYRGRLKQRGQ